MNARLKLPALLSAVTVFPNLLLLLNRGVYWDGWLWLSLIERKRTFEMTALLDQAKLPFLSFLFNVLARVETPVFWARALVFASGLVATLCVFLLLRRWLSEKDAFLAAALFSFFPAFLGRFELSVLSYSVCAAFFFFGTWLYVVANETKKPWARWLCAAFAAILFFLSFFTNSFLVFYFGVLAVSWWRFGARKFSKTWLVQNAAFILLPVVFWITKSSWGAPYGAYAGYNQFIFSRGLSAMAETANNVWSGILYGYFLPIVDSAAVLERKIFFACFLLAAAILFYALRKIRSDASAPPVNGRRLTLVGAAFFVLGLLPYLAVGKAPHLYGSGFGTRHALLLPFGAALMTLGLIKIFFREKWHAAVGVLLLAMFIAMSSFNYFMADMDSYKQEAIIAALAAEPRIANASTIVFEDQTAATNWQNRGVVVLEYTGYLNRAYPGGAQLGIGLDDYQAPEFGATVRSMLDYRPMYGLDRYNASGTVAFARMDLGEPQPTVGNWIKLTKARLFGSAAEYQNTLQRAFQIRLRVDDRPE